MTERAAEAGASVARIVSIRAWLSRQLDIVCIIVARALPRRVRKWAARLHSEDV